MIESKSLYLLISLLIYGSLNLNCNSQVTGNHAEQKKLHLALKIVLPHVSGRIDHITYDSVNRLAFIAALGNNTIEIVDIDKAKVIRTIGQLNEPQGVLFIASLKRFVVADGGNGDCLFFDATTYALLGVVHLNEDADNIRYDETSQFVYTGYGNGAIAIIDANTMKQMADIPLDGHPESFQLSKKQNRIYINVPGEDEIEVAELSTKKLIAKWKNSNASSNFPMALDEKNNRLFIGCRSPSRLRMINISTGKNISVVNCTGDADDVFYNASDSLVFVSGGKGFIDVFRANEKELVQIDHIKTSAGARTSLLLSPEKKFLLAVPAQAGNPAALWIYNLE
ncbi:MAG: YncE family protein [Chitinophagales bacterium]